MADIHFHYKRAIEAAEASAAAAKAVLSCLPESELKQLCLDRVAAAPADEAAMDVDGAAEATTALANGANVNAIKDGVRLGAQQMNWGFGF